MFTIQNFFTKYFSKIDHYDLELIISHVLKKPREFVLSHPEYEIPKFKIENLKLKISRRRRGEPLAYILGHKEFYSLDFKVNKNVLIPRPETELLVDLALNKLKTKSAGWQIKPKTAIIDVGTGSGNVIISVVKNLLNHKLRTTNYRFLGIDISQKAINIAKENAKLHKVDKKIKFLKGNLLKPLINKLSMVKCQQSIVILANLPYVSKKIYNSSPTIKHEPKSALLSSNAGLAHYEKLLKQIKSLMKMCYMLRVSCYMEISSEQKNKFTKLIKIYFPKSNIKFFKDLSGKWRVCEIMI